VGVEIVLLMMQPQRGCKRLKKQFDFDVVPVVTDGSRLRPRKAHPHFIK
jgi:hypothetical protein